MVIKYLTFISGLLTLASGQAQDVFNQLQRQMWYVKGDIYKGDSCLIHIEKPQKCSGYLLFREDELEMYIEDTENRFACSYEIIRDKLRLFYTVTDLVNKKTTNVNVYYQIAELSFGRDYRLTPINSSEFK
jgi:hypothetical protein